MLVFFDRCYVSMPGNVTTSNKKTATKTHNTRAVVADNIAPSASLPIRPSMTLVLRTESLFCLWYAYCLATTVSSHTQKTDASYASLADIYTIESL